MQSCSAAGVLPWEVCVRGLDLGVGWCVGGARVIRWGDLGGVIQSVYILEPALDTLATWLSCVKCTSAAQRRSKTLFPELGIYEGFVKQLIPLLFDGGG